jgi:RNA polymerase sigma-70 factor (ECF subfamily)
MTPMSEKTYLFRELFERNKRDLLAYFSRRVGSDDASDLLQETFVRALRYEAFHKIADPPAFLQRIATNLMLDLTRRRKREQAVIEVGRAAADAPAAEARPEEKIDFERQSRQFEAAMEQLPRRSREVLVLAIHHNLPLDEIARRLGISENSVRKQLRRAILRCRSCVDDD